MSIFLEPKEVKQLKASYSDWLSKLKAEEFIHKIYGEELISEFEYQKIMAMPTGHEKNSNIFHNVLMKATYNDVCRIRDVLLKSRQATHIGLAKALPNRDPNFNYTKFEEDVVPSVGERHTKNHRISALKSSTSTQREEPEDVEMDEDYLDLEEEYNVECISYASKPGQNTTRSGREEIRRDVSRPAARADYSGYQPMLKCYGVKPNNNLRTGKGLCAIMRNFTSELRGYEADSQSIKNFFGTTLGYDIIADDHEFVDLSAAEFCDKLRMLQGLLVNQYDRFVLFILSHGDEKGIKMCSPYDRKSEERNANGEPVRVSVDEIVDHFTHDKIKSLKSFPKCFFIQACQGDKVAAPAASVDRSRMDVKEAQDWEPPSHKVTNKADILVCLPSQKGTFSWVPSTGSWFIQETIAIFEKYYKKEHIVDMMVEVNNALSKREGKGQIEAGSSVINVYQMPGMACSLTKKFFLSIPPVAPYVEPKKK